MSLVELIESARRDVRRLTREQVRVLEFLGDRRQVLIQGCAGTGKTMLALKKARDLALAGKSVLLLCYNKPLGQWLERVTTGLKGDITTANYHAFVERKLTEAGERLPAEESKGSKYWERDLPQKFAQLLAARPLTYDAVIVDEGQDFTQAYWDTIAAMVGPDSYFFIFYDPEQNIYGPRELKFPIADAPYVMTLNCRNTFAVGRELVKRTKSGMTIPDDAPEGLPVERFPSCSDAESREALARLLLELLTEGVLPDQIVVLGAHRMENTWLGEDPAVGEFKLAFEPRPGSGAIRYETYQRFKGCESDVVILLDVDESDSQWHREGALLTAMSRAKVLLYIIERN
jgi:hypothetical protein